LAIPCGPARDGRMMLIALAVTLALIAADAYDTINRAKHP
jgi:hypothetical protein